MNPTTPTPAAAADKAPMTREEARLFLEAGYDASNPDKTLEAVAVIARFYAISDPRLLQAAADMEAIAGDLRAGIVK